MLKILQKESKLLGMQNFLRNLPGALSNKMLPALYLTIYQLRLSFPCDAAGNESTCNVGDLVWSLVWEDPLEEGMATHSSNPAWRIPMDREAWWTTVHGVAKSQTRLSYECFHFLSLQKSDDVTSGEKGAGITLAPSMMGLTISSHWVLPSLALCYSYMVFCGQKWRPQSKTSLPLLPLFIEG